MTTAERDPEASTPTVRTVRLPVRAPFAAEPLRRFLAAHVVAGVDGHDATARTHTRLVPAPGGAALVTVELPVDGPDDGSDGGRDEPTDEAPGVLLRLHLAPGPATAQAADEAAVVARVRAWLDLDVDPDAVDGALARDPLLAPLVAARPGLRVPGSVDGLETALFAVLGQQVSLVAARTFAARLMAAFAPVAGPLDGTGLGTRPETGPATGDVPARRALGGPDGLAAAGPEAVQRATGVTGARARAVHAVAAAAAAGLDLDHGDPAEVRAGLLALPGIGPWTAEYVALRCLGDPDAYLAGDLVLRRVLGVRTAREAEARAQGWRPYRGYALLHLWTGAVFA